MGRPLRAAVGGLIYHVLNRANGRRLLFEKPRDYEAFEWVLAGAHERNPMRVLAYCLMPNHWHLVIWPRRDGELSVYMRWLTLTHAQRWHAHRQTMGVGHLYQGRFKSFPVQTDEHFLTVCRYVERNALRAGLVVRAEEWRWSSLWHCTRGGRSIPAWLAPWPIERPRNWLKWVMSRRRTRNWRHSGVVCNEAGLMAPRPGSVELPRRWGWTALCAPAAALAYVPSPKKVADTFMMTPPYMMTDKNF